MQVEVGFKKGFKDIPKSVKRSAIGAACPELNEAYVFVDEAMKDINPRQFKKELIETVCRQICRATLHEISHLCVLTEEENKAIDKSEDIYFLRILCNQHSL